MAIAISPKFGVLLQATLLNGDVITDKIPKDFEIHQNFPNPFNSSTTIYYGIPEASFVSLTIYNLLGEKVAEIVSDHKDAGYYEATFDAKEFQSGVLLYRLQAGSFVETKKMILLK